MLVHPTASPTFTGSVTLPGTNLSGARVVLYPGVNNVGLRGNIYLGNRDSFGSLPAKTSETNIVYYNPTTGKLSYGAK